MNLILGDCLERMREMAENSIDAVVTDPPAGIGFMNKSWDSDKGGRDAWIAWMTKVMTECLRVLKPGGHALVWAIPRTSHWTATALENAGFEVRDVVTHLFGTGFPKSLDISKAIDKMEGVKRGQYKGWGTALKPASEHWILVRKPISEPTVAKNVLKHGVGGINIDASRIEGKPRTTHADGNFQSKTKNTEVYGEFGLGYKCPEPTGRFPSNLILDEEAAAALDAQSGVLKSGSISPHHGGKISRGLTGNMQSGTKLGSSFQGNSGGASRFFYVAKASVSEKNAGLEERDSVSVNDGRETSIDNPFQRGDTLRKNTHPTVKSIKLMEYLIKLITPPNGTVLDPFMGSGSTGLAAKNLGFHFIGIEREPEYFEIAQKRIPLS